MSGRRTAASAPRPLFVVSSVTTILALMMGTFVASMALVGPIRHQRDQATMFATLRGDLANATTPVNQTDDTGALTPVGKPIALLDVPQLGLREVVVEGTTPEALMSGPGHRRDTPLPGQAGTAILFGRQAAYGGPFRDIDTLKTGNVFTVTTGQGKAVYRVIGVRRAGQYAPPALAAGKGRIVLVTAAGRRWVPEGQVRVDADLVSAVQPSGARPLAADALPAPERALGTDSSGVWIAVMLLSQALLIVALVTTWVRFRWGRWQTWLAAGPVVLGLGLALSGQLAALLPNLM